MTRSRLLTLCSLLLALPAVLFPNPASSAGGVPPALAWLRQAQLADGGFSSGFSEGSDIGATADAIIAIASAGEALTQWKMDGSGPIDFLQSKAAEVTASGLAAKIVLALVAAGRDPSDFGGVDLPAVIAGGFNSTTTFYGTGPYDSSLAILALSQANADVPPEAIAGLLRARLPDGSYAFDGATAPGSGDSNTTALAVQALLIAGAGEEVIPSFTYFRQTQNADGGWTYQKPSAYGETTDANSTALVMQALLAGGQDLQQWGDPGAALLRLQQPSGALAFNADTPGDNALATIQAIPALASVDLTALSRLTDRAQGSGVAPTGAFFAVGLLLVAVLALAAIVGRSESS